MSPTQGQVAELYDPQSGSWTQTGKPYIRRTGHAATVLVSGGSVNNSSTAPEWPAAEEIYDPKTERWQKAAKLATPRAYHSATSLPDGGVGSEGRTHDYDPRRTQSFQACPKSQLKLRDAIKKYENSGWNVFNRSGGTCTAWACGIMQEAGFKPRTPAVLPRWPIFMPVVNTKDARK